MMEYQLNEVTDEFSKNLVMTIPRKLVENIRLAGHDFENEFQFDGLSVGLYANSGFAHTDETMIWWNGSIDAIEKIWVSDLAMLEINKNLQRFVDIEEAFYSPIIAYQRMINMDAENKIDIDYGTENEPD